MKLFPFRDEKPSIKAFYACEFNKRRAVCACACIQTMQMANSKLAFEESISVGFFSGKY
jgi:hypothetical protein